MEIFAGISRTPKTCGICGSPHKMYVMGAQEIWVCSDNDCLGSIPADAATIAELAAAWGISYAAARAKIAKDGWRYWGDHPIAKVDVFIPPVQAGGVVCTKTFAAWYDNGSGYYEGNPCGLIDAESAEQALEMVGGPYTAWGSPQVVTEGWHQNPNRWGLSVVLAGPNVAKK